MLATERRELLFFQQEDKQNHLYSWKFDAKANWMIYIGICCVVTSIGNLISQNKQIGIMQSVIDLQAYQ